MPGMTLDQIIDQMPEHLVHEAREPIRDAGAALLEQGGMGTLVRVYEGVRSKYGAAEADRLDQCWRGVRGTDKREHDFWQGPRAELQAPRVCRRGSRRALNREETLG
jgi:hypothetical protein